MHERMKRIMPLALITLSVTILSGCSVIETIFKAGMWTGIIMVVVVVALIIWLASKLFGGRD